MNNIFKNKAFKKIKFLALDRKGLGMELAMMVLLVAVGCSMLLVSFAMWGRDALLQKEQKVMQRLDLDEYAENVLSGITVEKSPYTHNTAVDIDNNDITIIKVLDASNKVLLEVHYKEVDTTKIITKWTYTKTGE